MSKFNETRKLALSTTEQSARSPASWRKFLDLASRMYRFDFDDQILIYAQRPDAAACASLEVWNNKMNRWVNKGSSPA